MLPSAGDLITGEPCRVAGLVAMARRAEELGFDSVWLADHFLLYFRGPDFPPLGSWECWMTASAIGAATTRVEIGTLVSSTSFRPPAVLAAMVNTLDDLTDGRLILGLGAGDAEKEHRAMGIPFEQRVGRFEEALTILHALLHEGQSSFEGRFYQTSDCQLLPPGPRAGGPPFLIGALAQSPRMLRLTAQYADIWNVMLAFGRSRPDAIPPLRAAVDAACRKHGRDPATLARSAAVLVDCSGFGWYPDGMEPLTGSPEELAEAFRAFAREGISHLQVATYPTTIEGIEQLAPVLELLDQT
ncbi:MAG TPA: LLM class flavin-dependent oxidoreductase [Thermomicrobiaceae bacterium]|nr:LLM class flavin-dependent oxidoreductase [Thermomicrobiaceae bacterium]